jgi:peptide/nickel transport system substrate-binding protein
VLRSVALGTVLGSGGFVAACDSGDDDDQSGTPARTALKGPKDAVYADLYPTLPRGGEVTLGISEEVPTSLNVIVEFAGATFWAADPVHDFLEVFDNEGRLRKSLVANVEQTPREVRYTLRDGIRFHNGRALTAQDVKKTFEYVSAKSTASPLADSLRGVTTEVANPRTVVLRSDRPNADLRGLLTSIPIIPVETVDKQAEAPIGCGPYRFKRLVRDAFVEYERYAGYWNPDAPRLERIRIQWYRTGEAGAQGFLSGETDGVIGVAFAQIPTFESREESGQSKTEAVEAGVVHLGLNHKRKPFDNALVRRAISLAVDRKAMAEAPFNGISRPYWFIGLKPDHPFYPKELEYPRDVERAKALMEEAGFGDGFRDRLLTPNVGYYQGVAAIAKQNLAEIGIELELELVDLTTAIERQFEQKDYSITVQGIGMGPVPSARIDRYVRSDGPSNYFNYASPEADALMDEARSAIEPTQRKELYKRVFEKVLIEDAALVPVASEPYFGAYVPETNFDQYRPEPALRWHYPIVATGV